MYNLFKNHKNRFMNKGKEGLLFLILIVGIFVACQGALEEGNPFGPSTSNVRIIPVGTSTNPVQIAKAANLTFTTLGGTIPVSWSISNTTIGNIIADTGVLTATAIAGTATITVVDAVGDTATAFIQVLPAQLVVAGPNIINAEAAFAYTATLTSGSGLVTASVASSVSSYTEGAAADFTIAVAAAVATITIVDLPTAAQGDVTLTLTILDTVGGDVGTVVITVNNDGT
jgi:hypothetical protein